MHIICPHCTTSYAIELHTLGHAGRTVRCSRCRQVWLARPQDVRMTHALVPSMVDDSPSGSPAAAAPPREAAAQSPPPVPAPRPVAAPPLRRAGPEAEAGHAPDLQAAVE